MKKFWEKVQDSVARQIVAGITAALSLLAYKAIPADTRQNLLKKLNEFFELIPAAAYLLILLIVSGVLSLMVWALSKRNRILKMRLRTFLKRTRVRGPAEFIDVGHAGILIRATYPVGIDIRSHPEQISTTPFCKEHKIELRGLPNEFSAFRVEGDYACDACEEGEKFDAVQVKKLRVLARSQLVKTWRPPEPAPEIAGNLFD